MRKIVLAVTFLVLIGVAPAFAFIPWVGSLSSDGGTTWINNVQHFDWASGGVGAALPTGLEPFNPNAPAVGQTFDFLYQARLAGLEDPNKNTVLWPGLNDSFEVTFVAVLPEMVTGLNTVGGLNVATFATLAGGQWFMYLDDAPNADSVTGMGFDDGHLVASGSFLEGQPTTFAELSPTTGFGAFFIDGLIATAHPVNPDENFFRPAFQDDGSVWMYDIHLQGTVIEEAATIIPTAFFRSRDGEGNISEIMTDPDWAFFSVDASSQFSVIPEPSTVILLGLGLLGLAGYSRKRFQK